MKNINTIFMKKKIDEIRYKLVSINNDINQIQHNQQQFKTNYITSLNPSIDIQNTKTNYENINLNSCPNRLKYTRYTKLNKQILNSHRLNPGGTPHFKTIADLDLFINNEDQFISLTKRDSINKNSNLMTESISNITHSNSNQKIRTNKNKLYIPEKMNGSNSKEFLKTIIDKNKFQKKKLRHHYSNRLKINSTISEGVRSFVESKHEPSQNRFNSNVLEKKLEKNKSIFSKLVRKNKDIYFSETCLDQNNNNKNILTEMNNNIDNNINNNIDNNININIDNNIGKDVFIKNTNQKFVIQKNVPQRKISNAVILNSIFSRNRNKNSNKNVTIRNKIKNIKKKNMSISYNNLIHNNNTCNLVIKTRPKIKYVNYEKNQQKYENLIHELIKINNDDYNSEIMNEDNIIDKYKAILNENMIYKNFIQKLYQLQVNSNRVNNMKNSNVKNNEKISINMLYDWIKNMSMDEKNNEVNLNKTNI